ncbi:MAG TPA: glutamate racemase, partial [Flavobacterium sp.]|uniref:glutamate racemase n=1 Tax=Flavobacterium sp. TaxID=239 RepID=UPI002CD14B4A
IYLADSKNAPYGQRTKDEIIALCYKNTDLLIAEGCKLIVVACNTATTNAIKELRSKYNIPFIGIEPAIKPAAIQSKTQTIGILATKGTINSELFSKAVATHSNVKIIEQIGHGLVQLVEEGNIDSPEMTALLEEYLKPMVAANIDYLVLGCTHYPYLIPQIKKIIPDHIQIIDSGEAVAKQTQNILIKNNLLNSSDETKKQIFYSNSDSKVLKDILGFAENVFEKEF